MTTVIASAIALNSTTALKSFEDLDFTMDFQPITSAKDIEDAMAFTSTMDRADAANVAHGEKLLYVNFARVVHLAQEVIKNDTAWTAFNEACSKKGISIPKDTANPYMRHVELLFATSHGGTLQLDAKWRNNLRAIRYLIESKVSPKDVPAEIAAAATTNSAGESVTRLLALNELDKKAHKPKASKSVAPSVFGNAETKAAIEELPPVVKITTPIALKFNTFGFALAVVRKGAAGEVEILYDAVLDDKIVMKGVRDGFKAI